MACEQRAAACPHPVPAAASDRCLGCSSVGFSRLAGSRVYVESSELRLFEHLRVVRVTPRAGPAPGAVLAAGSTWLSPLTRCHMSVGLAAPATCPAADAECDGTPSSLQIEMAILRFPYESWGTPFQQLKQVVEEPSPQLPADRFSPEFVDFTAQW